MVRTLGKPGKELDRPGATSVSVDGSATLLIEKVS
jgi:hypothetical protein